ncbi:MAG: hypothetical protein IKF19_00555 [Bacilli bacterium]|nr:hypothetical protein [Bacilli bacterium]
MKYDAITEILRNLGINNGNKIKTKELTENLDYFTKELNFELGNITDANYQKYKKTININNKSKTILLNNPEGENEIEVLYKDNNDFINLKFKENKAYIDYLNIKFQNGIYILDELKTKINYYDKETIDYILNKKLSNREEYYLDQKSIENYGFIADEEIQLKDDNKEQIKLFKKLITNSKEENIILLEEMKNKEKTKTLVKKYNIN